MIEIFLTFWASSAIYFKSNYVLFYPAFLDVLPLLSPNFMKILLHFSVLYYSVVKTLKALYFFFFGKDGSRQMLLEILLVIYAVVYLGEF